MALAGGDGGRLVLERLMFHLGYALGQRDARIAAARPLEQPDDLRSLLNRGARLVPIRSPRGPMRYVVQRLQLADPDWLNERCASGEHCLPAATVELPNGERLCARHALRWLEECAEAARPVETLSPDELDALPRLHEQTKRAGEGD
jgi:hypothetical protein